MDCCPALLANWMWGTVLGSVGGCLPAGGAAPRGSHRGEPCAAARTPGMRGCARWPASGNRIRCD
jgi:hypothetical protein